MSSTTPLTDAINALTTYANEVTGKSDETLSDAVESLADGYGGGSGGSDQWIGIVNKTISEAIDRQGVCNTIGDYAFYKCSKLTTVSFPNATSIGEYAFCMCSKLTTVSLSNALSVSRNAFLYCSNLTSISLPNATYIGAYAFASCSKLTSISLPNASNIVGSTFMSCRSLATVIWSNSYNAPCIYSHVFQGCYNLLSLYLLPSKSCKLQNINTFSSTPISTYTTSTGGVHGSIFVPESLYSTYISANNWSLFADRFVSLTDAQISNVLTYGTHNPT